MAAAPISRIVYWARLGLARAAITDALRAEPGVDLVVAETLDTLLPALADADALVCYDAPQPDARRVLDAIAAAGRLRWLHLVSAGREGFDAAGLMSALPASMRLSYAAGAVSPTVAEHALALLLAVARRVPEMTLQQAAARWDRDLATRAVSLEGGTAAIVGTGHIGIEIARRLRAFGMRTVGVSRRAAPHDALDESLPLSGLHAALGRADAVMVAIALADTTRHLLGEREFASCRRGAIVVNVARGDVLDQRALVAALRDGRLGGAGLDVTSPEPLPADDPLWSAPGALIAPHFGGSGSARSLGRLAGSVVENLRRLRAGGGLVGEVTRG